MPKTLLALLIQKSVRPSEDSLALCYTTLLPAVPYKVGQVSIPEKGPQEARQRFVFPCHGRPSSWKDARGVQHLPQPKK